MNQPTVGAIYKRWGGLIKEIFTDADTYDIQFPKDSDHNDRLLMIAACLMLDQAYFTKNNVVQFKLPGMSL